jgi:hypothetical protein
MASEAKAHTKRKSYEFYCFFVVPLVEFFGSAATVHLHLGANVQTSLDPHAEKKG